MLIQTPVAAREASQGGPSSARGRRSFCVRRPCKDSYLPACLPAYLPAYLPIYLHLSIFPSICLSGQLVPLSTWTARRPETARRPGPTLLAPAAASRGAVALRARIDGEYGVLEEPLGPVLPVSVNNNTPFARALAMRPSSRNCNPVPDLVLSKLISQPVILSGGVFFCSRTPVLSLDRL